jgi:hypothetical protein
MGAAVVRVSVLRCKPQQFAEFREMMARSQPRLTPGISKMQGLIAYFAGADEATSSLTNVSIWHNVAYAQQMDNFQPMLELGREFAAKGAVLERPVMNYTTLRQHGETRV